MRKTLAVLLWAATAAACTTDDSADQLIGHWRYVDEDDATHWADYTLDADGSFTYAETEDNDVSETFEGTYTIADGAIRFEGQDDQGRAGVIDITFFVDDTRFQLGALLPDGDVDGPVGRWHGHFYDEVDGEVALDVEITYDFADDGSATVVERSGDETDTYEGTWTEDGDEVVVTTEHEDFTFNVHLQLIEGEALGGIPLRRSDE